LAAAQMTMETFPAKPNVSGQNLALIGLKPALFPPQHFFRRVVVVIVVVVVVGLISGFQTFLFPFPDENLPLGRLEFRPRPRNLLPTLKTGFSSSLILRQE
jgi:hypothetical protein